MPSQLLHTLFGEDVISEIERRIKACPGITAVKNLDRIPNSHKKVFTLGCQGPDIFYHSQARRPVGLEYGTLLHRRGIGTFAAALLKLSLKDPLPGQGDRRTRRREKGINALGAYALGFMTHAILDRAAHPYIVYKSDRPPPDNLRRDRSHAFLERIIDLLMLKLLRGADISSWDQEGMLAETCEKPPLGLKKLLAKAIVMSYPERAGKDRKLGSRIKNTFLDCADFYRLTAPVNASPANPVWQSSPPRKGYVAYLYPEELPANIDFLNLKKRPWYYPAGEAIKDTRSFPEIYSGAVNTAADSLAVIIESFFGDLPFPVEEAARITGNGGLSIVDENGKPCAPSHTDPLPLQEVLNQQAELRNAV